MRKKLQIGVIGSAGTEEYNFDKPNIKMFTAAEEIGRELAKNSAIVINGGKGGVMEAVGRGAKSAGGIVAAEIAGLGRGESNDFVDIEVITGDSAFRGPSQLVGMSDGIISIGGGAGTLQELCVAYRMSKPVVLVTGFGGWTDRVAELDFLDERRTAKFFIAKSPRTAVKLLLNMLKCKEGEKS